MAYAKARSKHMNFSTASLVGTYVYENHLTIPKSLSISSRQKGKQDRLQISAPGILTENLTKVTSTKIDQFERIANHCLAHPNHRPIKRTESKATEFNHCIPENLQANQSHPKSTQLKTTHSPTTPICNPLLFSQIQELYHSSTLNKSWVFNSGSHKKSNKQLEEENRGQKKHLYKHNSHQMKKNKRKKKTRN
uniref:Uncharacterized protein n=1 Tax=Rhizophora mucronata TaxID=61149 RepID=A0A2P2MQU6_RHIMU